MHTALEAAIEGAVCRGITNRVASCAARPVRASTAIQARPNLLSEWPASALASAGGPAAHTRTGPVINALVAGDSYAAGNGSAGSTYNVSPDDPHTPPAPYSGSGCWRKYGNASRLAFDGLHSTGTYINRACSGT